MYMLPPRMYIYTYIYIHIYAVLLYLLILSYIICDAPPFFEQLKENITEEEEGRKNKRKKQHYCTIVLLNIQNIPLVHYTAFEKKSLAA